MAKILAIESSGREPSVALQIGDELLSTDIVGRGQAARLMIPAIGDLLRKAGAKPQELDGIAVVTGPGSFAGLRIGVTTAKTLAFGCNVGVCGFESLELAAYQILSPQPQVPSAVAVSDAQRQQFFAARYTRSDDPTQRPVRPSDIEIVTALQVRQILQPGDWLTGPAAEKIDTTTLDVDVHWVANHDRQPHATHLIRLASNRIESEQFDDFWKLEPLYIRPSAAEEKVART